MGKKLNLVILDSDYEYLRPMEEELIRRFSGRAHIQIITDPAYAKVFFHTSRNIDLLVADAHFYGSYLEEHAIRRILILVPGIEIERKVPEHVMQIVKYLPYKEILTAVDRNLTELEKEKEEVQPVQKPDTRVIAVYSPVGGCGKSLVAAALCRKMQKLDIPALLIGCDSLQSFSVYLDKEEYAEKSLADELKDPGEDTYWKILQNIKRGELTCLKPFEKALFAEGIGARELKTLVSILREKKDFDAVILDIGSELNEKSQKLMEAADVLVVVTQASRTAAKKIRRLQKNKGLMPNLESCIVCNQYGADESRDPGWKPSEVLPEYPDAESAMEDPIFYRLSFRIMEKD